MSEKKEYGTAIGTVIQYQDQDSPVKTRELNGSTLREFSLETANNTIKVTMWPEFADLELVKGQVVAVSGQVTRGVNKKDPDKPYVNMKAYSIFEFQGNIHTLKPKNVVNDGVPF